MPTLTFTDHRKDPSAWARTLGISNEAVELYLSSDVIDLHIDSFIWTRVFGYDITKRHGHGALGARVFSQVDLPRLREAQVTGGIWVITTNPLRSEKSRPRAFAENKKRLTAIMESCPNDVALVRTTADYARARAEGKHAVWLGIQGGNSVDAHADTLALLDDGLIVRVTLIHLTNSKLGRTSAPLPFTKRDDALSNAGRDFIRGLNARRVFVDLAHIDRRAFWDAVAVHDKSQPLIDTHTGVEGVTKSWRNLDDDQIRAIADTGGTIGIIFHVDFLADRWADARAESIVRHMEHVVNVGGEDVVSLGSDWDGAIVTPRDMPTCLELPKLVQIMLDRKWPEARVRKALGGNYLRALTLLRG